MKIRFFTTLGDLWFGSLVRLLTNFSVIGIMIAGSAFLTWSRVSPIVSGEHNMQSMLVWVAEVYAIHFAYLCGASFLCVAIVLPLLFVRKKGLLGVHELILQEEGLLEVTDVNRSLSVYSVIGVPKCVFGLYILSVGPGFLAFRAKRITEGNIDIFIEQLNEHKQAPRLGPAIHLS